jgi:Outer membrane protein beta-barrel domain
VRRGNGGHGTPGGEVRWAVTGHTMGGEGPNSRTDPLHEGLSPCATRRRYPSPDADDLMTTCSALRPHRITSLAARVVGALALAGAAAAPTAAQPAGSVEIGGYGQVTRVAPEQARFESRTPLSLGLRGRVNLHRAFGVEMEASTTVVEGAGVGTERRYNQLVARGTWTLPVSDFSGLMLGAGLARSDYEITYNFGPSALIGIRTLIKGRYALRSDALFNYLPTSGATEFGLRTGLQAVWGPFDGPTSRDRRRGRRQMQEPGSLEGTLFVQQWRLDDRWNLRDRPAIGSRIGVFLTSRSAFEVEATYVKPSVQTDGQRSSTGFPMRAGDRYRVTTFAVRYAHTLPVSDRVGVVAAFGALRSSYEYIDHWGTSGSAGARVALTRDVHLRADGVVNYLPGPNAVDLGARVGLSTLFRLGR